MTPVIVKKKSQSSSWETTKLTPKIYNLVPIIMPILPNAYFPES